MVAPRLIRSPTHALMYDVARSPINEDDDVNALTPAVSVPNPIISIAVTTTKKIPPNTAVPRIARGMSRWGWEVSSPRVDDASNPAKDRKPNTMPRNTVDPPTPCGR